MLSHYMIVTNQNKERTPAVPASATLQVLREPDWLPCLQDLPLRLKQPVQHRVQRLGERGAELGARSVGGLGGEVLEDVLGCEEMWRRGEPEDEGVSWCERREKEALGKNGYGPRVRSPGGGEP